MKKRKLIGMIALAAAAVLTLTACSSLQKSDSQESGSLQNTAEGTVIQQAGDTADSAAGTQDVSSVQNTADTSVSSGTAVEEEPDGEIIPDEDADAAEQENAGDTSDAWTGAYAGDEESVSIALLDESTISFAFAQSGISGTASVNGMQAVYNGDDHYVVVFNLNGSILDVSVSNEEDYDASGSPLNGTYTKE